MQNAKQHLWFTMLLASAVNAQNTTSNSIHPEIETLYSVVGVFHHSDISRLAAAVVYHRKGKVGQQLYWVGDLIDGGLAKLVRVEGNGAYFRYYGDYYFIPVDRYFRTNEPGFVRRSSTRTSHTSAEIGQSAESKNFNKLHSAVNRLKGLAGIGSDVAKMGTGGLRIKKVLPGSLLHSVGLRDGDVVQTFNGQKVGKSLQASTLIRALTLKGQAGSLGIIRNGSLVELKVKDLKLPKILKDK